MNRPLVAGLRCGGAGAEFWSSGYVCCFVGCARRRRGRLGSEWIRLLRSLCVCVCVCLCVCVCVCIFCTESYAFDRLFQSVSLGSSHNNTWQNLVQDFSLRYDEENNQLVDNICLTQLIRLRQIGILKKDAIHNLVFRMFTHILCLLTDDFDF